MDKHFDIAVIGGGPAGATTALCLALQGWRVGIFESTAFDQDQWGETLPPEVNPVLRELGLWDAFLSGSPLESPGSVSTWGSIHAVEVDFAGNAFGCGWHIDRKRFDRTLCRQAEEAGASLFLNCKMTFTAVDGRWKAEGVESRLLVNASGRSGQLLDPDWVCEDALLAIVIRVKRGAGASQDQRTWIETAPAGWWYGALLPDETGLAMFFTGAEIYRDQGISIEEQLQAAPLMRSRLENGPMSPVSIAYAPSGCLASMFGPNWVAVGDRASAYDPLSGRGIFKALRHGQAAARAIDATLRGDASAMKRYASHVRLEFAAYSQQRRRFYSAELRWADHPFWLARRSEILR